RLMLMDDTKQIADAGHAAASAAKQAWDATPFPLDLVAAPLAGLAAFESVMSFAQGGIVPNDSMAMVHKNEMVLPSNLSEGLQSMIGKPPNSGAGFHSQPPHVTMNVYTPDANSFRAS